MFRTEKFAIHTKATKHNSLLLVLADIRDLRL